MFIPFTDPSSGGGGSSLATYGPLLAAAASLAAVLISALGRKDKKNADHAALEDSQANTAIKGLSEAYDRINAERKEQETRADEAEERCSKLAMEVARLQGQIETLQQQIAFEHEAEGRLVSRVERSAAKKAPAKKAAPRKRGTK